MVKIPVLSFIVLLCLGCSYEYYPSIIQMRSKETLQENNALERLKLTGYYYSINSLEGEEFLDVFILYKDGTVYYPRTFPLYTANHSEYEEYYYQNKFVELKKVKKSWGRFDIINDTLIMYLFSGGGVQKIRLDESKYLIENDTTLLLIRENRLMRFYFKDYLYKPDSTNWIIKR